MDKDKRSKLFDYSDIFVIASIGVGAIGASIAALAFIVVGLWEIGNAISLFFGLTEVPENMTKVDAALKYSLKGIEFFFLAPLGYFVLRHFGMYAKNYHKDSKISQETKESILNIKALNIALLIGVVATDIIRKILSADGIGYQDALCGSLIIIVLGAYFYVLEKLSHKK